MASLWARAASKLTIRVAGDPRCPGCHEILDGATNFDDPGRMPKPGDKTVCIYCGQVLQYVPDPLLLPQPNESAPLALVFVEGDELILALARRDLSRYRRAVLRYGRAATRPIPNKEGGMRH
jgi:hypothetical protein